jgi:hypothetical protein
VAPTSHQTFGPATLVQNSLEGRGTALANFRLARGPVAPLERGSASLEGRSPPRVRSRLALGSHEPAASIPAPPTGAFNALTFAGAQVKDESAPRHAWESRPCAVPPTPPVRPSPPLCDAVRHGRCQSRDTVPPTLVRLTRRTLERERRNPQKGDGRLFHACPRLRRDVRLAGPVTSVAVGPVRPSPPSRHHPGHCTAIPDAVGVREKKTQPHQLLCALRPPDSGTLKSASGRPPNERPLHRHPRSRSWTDTRHAMTSRQKRDSPGQSSTPRHYTSYLHT